MGNVGIKTWAGAALAVSLAAGLEGCNRRDQAPAPAPAAPPLLTRADLFGAPARENVQLSPRGDLLAFVAPRDGAPNIWVVSAAAMDQPRAITDDQSLGVRDFRWAFDNASLLYLQDEQGDGADRLFAIPAAGGDVRPLTPQGVRAQVLGLSPNDPNGVVVSLNQRDPAWADVYRIDIATGARTLLYRNVPGSDGRGFAEFVLDRDNRLRLGLKANADGGAEMFARDAEGRWSSLFAIPFEDVTTARPIAFDADGRSFLMLDSTGRDRASLVRVDARSGVKTVLGESQRADVVDVWLDPSTNAPEAYASDYLRPDWRALEPDAQADLDFFEAHLQGEARVVSRSLDDSKWVVEESAPTTPARSYLYDRTDRAHRTLTLLFRHRPTLEQAPLQPMTPVEIEARDGLTLVSYLTLPIGSDANGDARPDRPTPLVIAPHSDAWGRDSYGYDPLHQWLANRGYAVLSVNFRGSSGFGKAFHNAGNGQWGGRMQEDLLDAVQWAVSNGVARADRIAIMGASYGGYAALSGLAFSPDRFRCGVSYAGDADLSAMLDSTPPWRNAYRNELYLRVGDPRTAEGRQLLRERSPISRAGDIRAQVLLATGGQGPAALRAGADAIAQNVRSRRLPLIYLNYPDEGRTLTRQADRLSFYAVAEQFLSECLGGRVELVGAAFDGANLQAIDGAARVPGLSAFARRAAAAPAATALGDSMEEATPLPVTSAAPASSSPSLSAIETPKQTPPPASANDN